VIAGFRAKVAGFRRRLARSGQIGSRNLADQIPSPDSGDINRMFSNSDTGNISMVVGCLNVKVDCAV